MAESISESEPTPLNHIGPVLDLLASAGYGDAKNSQFSDFEMLFHGLAWCISSANTSDHPCTIETVDDIGEALKLMGCPHVVQATWIEDLNYACIYPAVKWVVSLIKAQQHESSDENARKAILEEMQVLKEKIEEARIGSIVQTLASLLKKSKDLERQGAVLQSDYNLNRLRLQSEITQLEEQLANDNSDNNPHEFFDRTNIELSKKLTYAKKELSSKLREIVSLKRQLDELPIDVELVQYERRFSELNVHMQDRHSQTRKYYETYNALLEIKDLMLKETSLLNSVDSQFGDAIGNTAGRAKLIDSMEAILKGIQQKLEKVQLGLQMEQKTLNTFREQYTAAVMNQRQCSALSKDYQEECRKNERLKKELALHEKQRSPNSS